MPWAAQGSAYPVALVRAALEGTNDPMGYSEYSSPGLRRRGGVPCAPRAAASRSWGSTSCPQPSPSTRHLPGPPAPPESECSGYRAIVEYPPALESHPSVRRLPGRPPALPEQRRRLRRFSTMENPNSKDCRKTTPRAGAAGRQWRGALRVLHLRSPKPQQPQIQPEWSGPPPLFLAARRKWEWRRPARSPMLCASAQHLSSPRAASTGRGRSTR